MNKNDNQLEVFSQFAEERLTNHLSELNTRYENEKIDKETMKLAYAEHQKIYSKELEDKINSLPSGDKNEELKSELQNASRSFLAKLSLKQS